MQRIWPVDQDRAERFRRIPFSPVNPRADIRAQRKGFSRGCPEAARLLNNFIEEIRATGVPEMRGRRSMQGQESRFEDGFPTVDLPSVDLGGAGDSQDEDLAGMTPHDADGSGTPHRGCPPNRHASVSASRRSFATCSTLGVRIQAAPTPAFMAPAAPPYSGTALQSLDIVPSVTTWKHRRACSGRERRRGPRTRPRLGAARVGRAAHPLHPPDREARRPRRPGRRWSCHGPRRSKSSIEKVSIES